MDKNELIRLENKLKVDHLSDEEVRSLISEIKRLKVKLDSAQSSLEDTQGAKELKQGVFVFVLSEDNPTVEVPARVVGDHVYIRTNNQLPLTVGRDFTMKQSKDADTYVLDFSNYIYNTFNPQLDEGEYETITIYYSV